MLYQDLSDEIIHAFYQVYNTLGFGFAEKVYKNSLYIELQKLNLLCEVEKKIKVFYDNRVVGEFFADMVIENKIILELKAVETIIREHEYQVLNYLKASQIEVGLLLNFGKQPEIKRFIYTNDRK